MVKSSSDTLWEDRNPRSSACRQKTMGVTHNISLQKRQTTLAISVKAYQVWGSTVPCQAKTANPTSICVQVCHAVHIYTWHVNSEHIFQKQSDCESTFLSVHLWFKEMSLHVRLIWKRPKNMKLPRIWNNQNSKFVLENPWCGNRPYIRLPVFGLRIIWHHVVKTGKSTLQAKQY